MFDWDKLKSKLKCCACDRPMVESEFINGIMLNKKAEWQYPAWGNILAIDKDKKQFNRATAIVCDVCIANKEKPIYAVEYRYKDNKVDKVIYHVINELEDVEPIEMI